MNAYRLERELRTLTWADLKRLARTLELSDKGGRMQLIERVLETHALPTRAVEVCKEAAQYAKKKRARSDEDRTPYRSLDAAFDAAANE